MGFTRLLLAIAVLFSHTDLRIVQLNPGVTAVIGFYLISGYVMTGLIDRHFSALSRVPAFYVDRALRLYPQYLVYAGLVLAWFLATGTQTLFLTRAPTVTDLLNNLTVVPLNFYMYNGADGFTLIPPAWSLGAEFQFYLLAPLMVLLPRVGVALGLLSIGVHALALAGVLHTDWFGYRLLPGVLWVFAAGSLLFRWQRTRPGRATALAAVAPLAALAIYLLLRSRGLHTAPYHQEVLLGWGLGLPLLHWVSRLKPRRLDDLAGDLSYGVFLNHFLLIWVLFPEPDRSPAQLLLLLACSLALSWAVQFAFERPVLAWRRRLRVSSRAKLLPHP